VNESTRFAASADGTRIAYETLGSGPALVIVDGAMNFRGFGGGRPYADALQSDVTSYFYDRRGRGESDPGLPVTPEREIEDLAAVVAATGETPFVVGFSSGAGLALRAAAAGVPMRAVAAFEAPWIGTRPYRGREVDYRSELQRRIDAGDRAGAVDFFMGPMVGAPWFMSRMMRMMRGPWATLMTVAHTIPYDAAIMDSHGWLPPTDELARIVVPTLVLGGSKYKPTMKAAVDGTAAAIPGAEKVILEGQTHMVSPASIAPELIRFFARTITER
jgi:pimeloyl-ACP methyl ester carboxylesterase